MYKSIVFLCCLLPLGLAAQSGWTRNKGTLFLKADVSLFSSNRYYNPAGDLVETNRFQQRNLNFYGEYGLSNRLTLTACMPLLRLNSFENTTTVAGIGDLRLEAKYRLTGNRWPVSLSIAPELPTGRANAFATNKQLSFERIKLPTGDGEFNVWTTLSGSKSIGKTYISVFGAYNFRTQYMGRAFRDLYQLGAEFGYHPWGPLWLNAKLRAQLSNGESWHADLGFVRGDATTYTLVSAEAYYKLSKKWGVAATWLSGSDLLVPFRNIYIAPYFSIGVVYER